MKSPSLVLVAAAALAFSGRSHATDFTCWTVAYPITAAAVSAESYWTPDRRSHAIPDEEAETANKNGKTLAAQRVDVTETPYKYGGKLFFTRGGVDYTASAQFVDRENIVIAAGHSLYKGGQAQNIIFYRGYANGGGTAYKIEKAGVLTAWTKVADDPPSVERSALDYSVMLTIGKSDAGVFALALETDFTQAVVIGYPGNRDSGKYMYKSDVAKYARIGDTFDARPSELLGGSSGGAWFTGNEKAGYSLVSTVSGGNVNDLWGPVMTDKTAELIAHVANKCQ